MDLLCQGEKTVEAIAEQASLGIKNASAQLKELDADGLIIRTEFPQIPPKVEYALSEKGISLIPVFEAMSSWGQAYMPNIEKSAV